MASLNTYAPGFPNPLTPSSVISTYRTAFFAKIEAGELQPLLLPQFLISLTLLYLYLLIPHTNRPWLYHTRWLLLGFILLREIGPTRLGGGYIWKTSSMSMGTGFGVGLISAWTCVWSCVWLVFEDPQRTAKRVERRLRSSGTSELTGNGHTASSRYSENGHGELRQRPTAVQATIGARVSDINAKETGEEWEYFWQPFPEHDLWARIGWVGDLVTSFRGPGWNWEIPTNPGLPRHVKVSMGIPLNSASVEGVSHAGIRRFSDRYDLSRYLFPRLLGGYILLDILKVVLMKDPFFIIGPNDLPLPPHLSWLHPFAISFLRKMLCCTSIVTALECIFSLSPLCFCLILGPTALGVRGEAWMYPTTWGPISAVCDKGLAGLWGSWWHQTFRKGFSAPTEYLIRKGFISQKSVAAKVIGVFFAFTVSGIIHAAGSVTQIPPTKPLDLILFFQVQGLGILVEAVLAMVLKPFNRRSPSWARKTGNFIFAFIWIYSSAGYLVDDFSRAIWLFEPVPFSFMRGLGFGFHGEGFLVRIDPYNLELWRGKHWWNSGIMF